MLNQIIRIVHMENMVNSYNTNDDINGIASLLSANLTD